MTATTLKQVLLRQANTTYDITEKLFSHVSDGQLCWVPATGKNWMTAGQLLMHCASFGCGKAVQGFVRGDWGLPETSESTFQQLTLMIEHLSQHKGQLFYYLKLMGKDVNTSDLWGA